MSFSSPPIEDKPLYSAFNSHWINRMESRVDVSTLLQAKVQAGPQSLPLFGVVSLTLHHLPCFLAPGPTYFPILLSGVTKRPASERELESDDA